MIISKDTIWHAGEVIELTSRVEIPEGVTLTIEPGVTIKGNQYNFLIGGGNLIAKGTESEPIEFLNTGVEFLSGYRFNNPSIDFEYVHYSCTSVNGNVGFCFSVAEFVNVNIINSTFYDTPGFNFYGETINLSKNIFVRCSGLRVDGGGGTIENNVFVNSAGYAINMGSSLAQIHYNSFLTPLAISASSYIAENVNAQNNYFGTNVLSEIENKINDRSDTIAFKNYVDFKPYLIEPDSNSPSLDSKKPSVSTFIPADGSTDVGIDSNIILTFSETIQQSTGRINLYAVSTNGKINSIPEKFINISISGHDLVIDPRQNLSYNTHYFVTLASGTVKDLTGNDYQGTTTYDFTTSNTVTTSLSTYTLSAKEPNDLTYIGSSDFTGTGNAKNNIITSGIGNDILDGVKGTDTLIGGKGNDRYIVDSIKDIVVEEVNSGIDTIQSSVTFSLAALVNVENLTLIGTKAINGTGNNLDNIILGNSAKNVINGGLGNDILTGGNSADTFQFNTALNSNTNVDTITDFVHGTDKIQLSRSIMSNLNSGTKLNPLDFALSTAVLDASDRIIYDQSSGALYYDADGSGAVAAIQIAIIGVETHANLTATDFILAK